MVKEEEDIIGILERTGFPLERKIRKVLRELGIETSQTRYFETFPDRKISRDLDISGHVILEKFEKSFRKKLYITLRLWLIGQVKKLGDHKICFYEIDEKIEDYKIPFPNLLNKFIFSDNFGGGYTNFHNYFEHISLAKEISILEKNFKGGDRKNCLGLKESGGNEPIYTPSNELIRACEFYHNLSINYVEDNAFGIEFFIGGCFPIIFTEADIFKVFDEDKLKIEKTNSFIYLIACPDMEKIPLTTRKYYIETYYLPVLVTNFDGIKSSVDMIKKIGNAIYKDVENASGENMMQEFQDHKNLAQKIRKDDIW